MAIIYICVHIWYVSDIRIVFICSSSMQSSAISSRYFCSRFLYEIVNSSIYRDEIAFVTLYCVSSLSYFCIWEIIVGDAMPLRSKCTLFVWHLVHNDMNNDLADVSLFNSDSVCLIGIHLWCTKFSRKRSELTLFPQRVYYKKYKNKIAVSPSYPTSLWKWMIKWLSRLEDECKFKNTSVVTEEKTRSIYFHSSTSYKFSFYFYDQKNTSEPYERLD